MAYYDTPDKTDSNTAIAPPITANQPVAPVTAPVMLAQATVPVVKDKTGSVVARPGTASGMSGAYLDAAQSGDPDQMLQFAKSAQGTEFEKPAMNAWRGMANRVSQFDEITSAIDKKGGPNSPQGKLEMVNQWPKAQNEPSIVRALSEHLMGNPNARFFVSEGMVKPKIIYDRAGKPLQENWTESGVLKNVIDPITGKEVSPDEYATRGAGLTDTKDTLPYIADKKQLDMNQQAAFKAQAATNDIAAAAPQLAIMHNMAATQMQKLFESRDLQDLLTPQERAQLASFATRTVQLGGSASQGINALDQYTRNGGQSLSNEQKKNLGAALKPYGFEVDASGSVIDKNGQHVDNSKLKSLQQTGAFGKNFEQNFTQSAEEAMNSQILKKLNPQQQQQFGSILDLTKQIEQKKLELAQKHGSDASLPFLVNSILPSMGDQYARFQVQQSVGQANAEIAKDYADYRREMLKNYSAGSAPAPGEIERAYSGTTRFAEKRDQLRKNITEEMNQINKTVNKKANISTEPIAGQTNPEATVNAVKPPLPAINTSIPTQSVAPPTVPPISAPVATPGFKVIRNSDRQFKVKE